MQQQKFIGARILTSEKSYSMVNDFILHWSLQYQLQNTTPQLKANLITVKRPSFILLYSNISGLKISYTIKKTVTSNREKERRVEINKFSRNKGEIIKPNTE